MEHFTENDICIDGTAAAFPSEKSGSLETSGSLASEKISPIINRHDDSFVRISKAEFDRLNHELESKDRKLKALLNINLLLREKDEEVSSLKEKNKTYADALMMSEMRNAWLVKLATKVATQGKESQDPELRHSIDKKLLGKDPAEETDELVDISNLNSNSEQKFVAESHRLVDGGPYTNSGRKTASDAPNLDSSEVLLQGKVLTSVGVTQEELPVLSKTEASDAPSVSATGQESLQTQLPAFQARGVPAFVSSAVPGVSKDLVSKLIQQNARLKKTLRQVMNNRGLTVEDYLDKQEYASVVEQLRQEIRLLQLREKAQEQLLISVKNSDMSELAKRNLQHEELIQKLKRMLAVKQAMVDVFSSRCEELEGQAKLTKDKVTPEMTPSQSGLTQATPATEASPAEILGTNISSERASTPSLICTEIDVDGTDDNSEGRFGPPSDRRTQEILPAPSETFPPSFLVCQRCEREFSKLDEDKFLEHCMRCSDD